MVYIMVALLKVSWNDIKKREDCIYISCHEPICEHKCPFCGEEISSIHSNYIRTIGDLPIQNNDVKLIWCVNWFMVYLPYFFYITNGWFVRVKSGV